MTDHSITTRGETGALPPQLRGLWLLDVRFTSQSGEVEAQMFVR
jgi:hypothetical protein